MRTSALQYLYLQKPISSVIIICAIALLPWLGNDFQTVAESYETSVATSIIESGNWILPKAYTDEAVYKPPMAYWLMAAVSLPQGQISGFTSRLPSAIAQIVLIGFVLAFFGKRIRFQEAFIATLLLLTCFGMHQAGTTAQGDMLFATFIVLGLMQLYRWENKLELKGLPVIIPLLLSCAILTKGFAGIILPLFIFCVYLLILRKYSSLKIIKSLLYIGISSMFIPLIWYIEAYKQGGADFLNAIFIENCRHLLHPGHGIGIFHNFISLLSGFIPWTLLFVFSLFGAKWCMPRKSFKQILKDAWNWFLSIEKMKRFSIVAALCIILFYAIPAYPFISILLAQYFIYITENRSKVTRIFAHILTAIVSIIFIAGILIMTQVIDLNAIAAGYTTKESTLHIIENIAGILVSGSITNWIIMSMLLISIVTVIYQTTKRINIKILYATILMTFCLNLFIDGIVMKGIKEPPSCPVADHSLSNLNSKLPKPLADASNIISPACSSFV